MTIVKLENADVKISVAMNLKHFKYEEFKSPDVPNSGNLMDADFLAMLDSAREIAGIPFKINSAYRSESHNQAVGGKPTSSHLVGKAVDLHCTNSRDRWTIITALQKAGFTRFGIAKTFIHVDSDENKSPNVIWTY